MEIIIYHEHSMHTDHTIMPLTNLRVHIAPVGFEIDRIVLPAKQMKADKIWLLVHDNPSQDKATPFVEKIQKQLKKEKIKVVKEHHDRLDLFQIIKTVKKIIEDEKENNVYVNLASGSKIQALKIIKENSGKITKKEMAELTDTNGLISINAEKENYTQARFASLDQNIIQPLLERWHFIEIEKIGRTRWIKITQEGINASEFLL